MKRLAAKASLQRPAGFYEDQIMTPQQLYDFCLSTIANIHFHFSTLSEYEVEGEKLEERFSVGKTIEEPDHCMLSFQSHCQHSRQRFILPALNLRKSEYQI